MTASTLAEQLQTNRWTLQRGFKDALGMSPYQFILRARLNRARQQLADRPGLNIATVALATGFPSASAFATHYRRFYGENPSETQAN